MNLLQIMINKIIHGDCLEEMGNIPDKSVDMVLCDLPYGTIQAKWDSILPFELLWAQYERVVKEGGAIVLFGSQPFTTRLINSNLKNFKYEIIWEKSRPNGFLNANKMPMKKHENICVFSYGRCRYFPQGLIKKDKQNRNTGVENCYGKVNKNWKQDITYTNYPVSILRFNNPTKPKHPTQKQLDLCEYLIKTYSLEGEIVLDNTAGSFSTSVASDNCRRNWICIEKELEYCLLGLNRVNENRSCLGLDLVPLINTNE